MQQRTPLSLTQYIVKMYNNTEMCDTQAHQDYKHLTNFEKL